MGLRAGAPAEKSVPQWLNPSNQRLLITALRDASVVYATGKLDAAGLRTYQQVVELLPHFKAEESARTAAPRSSIVLTVPQEVKLPERATHLQRSLSVWISEALISANKSVLLAAPYWSSRGNDFLLSSLSRATELGLPITLAGARREDEASYDGMMDLAEELGRRGGQVNAYSFLPPRPNCLFHAKIVAGRVGYLGSANLTASGFGEHVEVGAPLLEADVEKAWWLVDVLLAAGLLVRESA